MKPRKISFPNGLRLIFAPAMGRPSVTVMVAVETGSNYEPKVENGLSHFLEHMCFKGTESRPTSLAISEELESLGAESNAFTSYEFTGYYARADKKYFKNILDIVSDLYLNPTLPAGDLEIERGVILQEISMYEDLPQVKVKQLSNHLLYGDTPAGRPIIGLADNIKKFQRSDFVKYRKKHYVAEKTFVVVSGDLDFSEVKREVKKLFKNIPRGKKVIKPKVVERQKSPTLLLERKKSDQTHLVVAFRAYGGQDKRLPALSVLSTILGRGTSSRLFQKLREDLGACYYIRASVDTLTDHGSLQIATGVELKRLNEIVSAILAECKKLRVEPVSASELKKAKEYIAGKLHMNLETTDVIAEFFLEQEAVTGKPESPEAFLKKIKKVRVEDVLRVAQDIFQDKNLNLTVLGDAVKPEPLKKVLSLK